MRKVGQGLIGRNMMVAQRPQGPEPAAEDVAVAAIEPVSVEPVPERRERARRPRKPAESPRRSAERENMGVDVPISDEDYLALYNWIGTEKVTLDCLAGAAEMARRISKAKRIRLGIVYAHAVVRLYEEMVAASGEHLPPVPPAARRGERYDPSEFGV